LLADIAVRAVRRAVSSNLEGRLTTEYHAKLFVYELTRQRSVADAEKAVFRSGAQGEP
jgi:hypothetical protein